MARKINFHWNLRQLMAAHDLVEDHRADPVARQTGNPPVRDTGVSAGH